MKIFGRKVHLKTQIEQPKHIIDMTLRGWGHNINFWENSRISGWVSNPRLNSGEYLALKMKSGRVGVYRLRGISYYSDPPDMFNGYLDFWSYADTQPFEVTQPDGFMLGSMP